jgi:hypothetical protein
MHRLNKWDRMDPQQIGIMYGFGLNPVGSRTLQPQQFFERFPSIR